MKKRNVSIAVLVSSILVVILLSAQAHGATRGYWETYTHTVKIKVGLGKYHQHRHESALNGYAYVVSATGEYSFQYEWDAPYLHVWIENADVVEITVTFKCRFYVN